MESWTALTERLMGRLAKIFALSGLLLSPVIQAKVHQVVWVTPEWQNYTQVDGLGLYNELVQKVFAKSDTRVRQIYRSWNRSLMMLRNQQADMTGGMEKSGNFHFSAFPILSDYEYVLFRTSAIPSWKGIESLNNKTGVWIEGYLEGTADEIRQYLQGFGVSSRAKALDMFLNKKRGIKYLLDNRNQLMLTLGQQPSPLDETQYSIKQVYQANLYMAFQKSPRGLQIKHQFDTGFKALFCDKKLLPLYAKYQFEGPNIDIQCSDSGTR